ncbi:TRAP transporter small permease [Azospirillum halopraeferens]|uniref:TRAP transporter small permease n=1 Tax=Azospirillum halopraeferens TaxID=34010 RepID=UPI00146FB2E4|nr:TRAP transporter small permease [Azospirillum halopraeferens]
MPDARAAGGEGERLHRLLSRALGVLAAVLLFGMAVMTTADVAGRALLGYGVPGSYELTSMMLAALIFVGLPLTTERDEHVAVDLADHVLPTRWVRVMAAVAGLLSTVVLAVLAWQLAVRGAGLGEEGAVTNILRLPLAPVAYLAAATTGLSAAVQAARTLAGLRGR